MHSKLENEFGSVKSYFGNKKLGDYDKAPPSLAMNVEIPSIQNYLASIPSTAMWLLNKVSS